jgi:hypothetical protein
LHQNPDEQCQRQRHLDETIASTVLPYLIEKLAHGKESTYLDELMVKIEGSPTALKAAQMVAGSPENMPFKWH